MPFQAPQPIVDWAPNLRRQMPAKMRKPRKSFADYVAILIAPVLIMAMVGSLVFFLLEAFVDESPDTRIGVRLRWVLFWFVVGSVLVGRIAVQQGSSYAGIYAFGLAAATGMWIIKFFGFVYIPIALLTLIWWATHKLTWDVTLIDDDEDATGEGLLKAAGVDMPETATIEETGAVAQEESGDDDRVPLWQRIFANKSERKGKAHSPGLWIVWISLIALPVFGFAQLGLDETSGERRMAFIFLTVYMAAALSLLLCASFLGLRRYLRQRYLKMPLGVTGSWVTLGVGVTIATMLACLILPRPDASMSLPQIVDKVSDAAQEASEWAFLKDGGVEDEDGRKIGEGDEDDPEGKNGSGSETGEEEAGETGEDGEQPGEEMDSKSEESTDSESMTDPSETSVESDDPSGMPGEQNGKGENSGTGEESGKTGQQSQAGEQGEMSDNNNEPGPEENPESENDAADMNAEEMGAEENTPEDSQSSEDESSEASMDWIGSLVTWLLYAALALGAIWFFMKHRKEIMAALRQFWANILTLFGRKPPQPLEFDEEDETPELPPFAAFQNPFTSGAAGSQSPEELVRYSFEALQAWAKERELERLPDQTPIEFARRLGAYIPELAHEAGQLTRLYSGYAYAGRNPPGDCVNLLQSLWAKLG